MKQPVAFLSVDVVLKIHRRVIEEFGGDPGLRDRRLLECAVAMPQSTFGGVDLHVGLPEKAAAHHFHLCGRRQLYFPGDIVELIEEWDYRNLRSLW